MVGSISNDDLATRRQRHGLTLQVDRHLGRRGRQQLGHVALASTTQSRPTLAQLERKMSAYDGAITAR